MKKMRMFLDIDKETQWLNEMDSKGWECNKVNSFGIFYFHKKGIENNHYQIDFQEFHRKSKFEEYVKFHEDFGWKLIGGSWSSGKYYWQSNSTKNERLFSDPSSELHFYNRALNQYLSLAVLFMVFFFILNGNLNITIFGWRDAFYTPGLWEMTGSVFWSKFLFELPFAFLRWGAHLGIGVFVLYNFFISVKIQQKINQIKKLL